MKSKTSSLTNWEGMNPQIRKGKSFFSLFMGKRLEQYIKEIKNEEK